MLTTTPIADERTTTTHRAKLCFVYVRQSSPGQVRHHQESTELQYRLVERAVTLGWPRERVRIGYAAAGFPSFLPGGGRVVSRRPGQGSLEHGRWAGRCHWMSCELALVVGRPCDQPGCAASADP